MHSPNVEDWGGRSMAIVELRRKPPGDPFHLPPFRVGQNGSQSLSEIRLQFVDLALQFLLRQTRVIWQTQPVLLARPCHGKNPCLFQASGFIDESLRFFHAEVWRFDSSSPSRLIIILLDRFA